jgi:hypothetical protein
MTPGWHFLMARSYLKAKRRSRSATLAFAAVMRLLICGELALALRSCSAPSSRGSAVHRPPSPRSFAIIVTTVPILIPVLKIIGIDTVWFGITILLLNEIGLIHPPYGLNLFVIQGVRQRLAKLGEKVPMADVYMGTLPFLIPVGLGLALIYLVPGVALRLPNAVMGR